MLRRTFLVGTAAALAAGGQETGMVSGALGSLVYIQDGTLWIRQVPDGAPRALATGKAIYGPKFSPSGRWILFRDGDESLRLVSADGKFLKSWTAAGQWLPGGDELAVSTGEQTLVLAADDNWSSPRRTFSGSVGAISPHGGQRTWQFSTGDGTQLFMGRFDRPDEATVVDQTQFGGFRIFGFARGGSRFLYWKTEEAGADVWSGLLDVYMAGGSRPVNTGLASLPGYDNAMMSLSPTANTLAAVVGEDHMLGYDKGIALLDISSDTSLTQKKITGPLVSAIYPAWSPDGEALAWAQGPEGKARERRIWLAGDRGLGVQKQLTNDARYADEAPVWSRDGKYILFGRTDVEDKRTVWLMRAEGSGVQEVAEPRERPVLYLPWSSLLDWSFR